MWNSLVFKPLLFINRVSENGLWKERKAPTRRGYITCKNEFNKHVKSDDNSKVCQITLHLSSWVFNPTGISSTVLASFTHLYKFQRFSAVFCYSWCLVLIIKRINEFFIISNHSSWNNEWNINTLLITACTPFHYWIIMVNLPEFCIYVIMLL